MTTPSTLTQVTQVAVSTGATLVWNAGQGQVTFINPDQTHTIYIGSSSSVAVGGTNTYPLSPLSSVSWNGLAYAVAPSGTMPLVVVSGDVSYTPGGLTIIGNPTVTVEGTVTIDTSTVTILENIQTNTSASGTLAQEGTVSGLPGMIAETGVPLLTASAVVCNETFNLTTGIQTSYGPFPISQTGYEVNFSWRATTSGTANDTSEVIFTWQDTTTGNIVGEEYHFFANPTGTATVVGVGPTKGNELTITILNNDTVTVDYTIVVLQNSRTYMKDQWQQAIFSAGYPGYSVAGGNNYSGILFCQNPSLVTNGTATYICPYWDGRIWISASSTNAWAARLRTLDPNAAANPVILNLIGVASQVLSAELTLPRSMCTLELVNTGSTTASVGALIVMEYAE